MAGRRDIATQISSSFPGNERRIDRAYRDDPIFRDLCDDYGRCAAALERWQRSSGDELVDVQDNSRIGAMVAVPFKGRHVVKIGYFIGVRTEFGSDFDQFQVTYQVLFK